MERIQLSVGTIEYEDTGGDGPVVVLLHGLVMDGRVWRDVVADLHADHRCVLPTLPFGAHRVPMDRDADLSLRGIGRLVAELLKRLDLQDVTLCFNDWGGAATMIADGLCERAGRLALVSCEAYENYPPGLPGRMAWASAHLPGGIALMRQTLLRRAIRNLPMVYGHMSRRGIPEEVMRAWLEPLARREIQRDLRKYAGQALRGRRDMLAATPALRTFDRPVLVAWGRDDHLMPIGTGRRLAEDLPHARFVEIPDSYTLVPWDQPTLLAGHLRELTSASTPRPGHSTALGEVKEPTS